MIRLLKLYRLAEGQEKIAPGVWISASCYTKKVEFRQIRSPARDFKAAAEKFGAFDVTYDGEGTYHFVDEIGRQEEMWDLSHPKACYYLAHRVADVVYDLQHINKDTRDPSEIAQEICANASNAYMMWNDIYKNKNLEPMHGGRGADIDEPDDSPHLEGLGMYTGISEPLDFAPSDGEERAISVGSQKKRVAGRGNPGSAGTDGPFVAKRVRW